jgi:hypothetical protein
LRITRGHPAGDRTSGLSSERMGRAQDRGRPSVLPPNRPCVDRQIGSALQNRREPRPSVRLHLAQAMKSNIASVTIIADI